MSPWFFFFFWLFFSLYLEGPFGAKLRDCILFLQWKYHFSIFSLLSASAIYDLHAVLSTMQYLKMNWVLKVFLFIYLFFPGNCTNPLNISLFPGGWVIYYRDPAGQISKNLTQNEQLSLFCWVMGHRILNNDWWMGGKKQEKRKAGFSVCISSRLL